MSRSMETGDASASIKRSDSDISDESGSRMDLSDNAIPNSWRFGQLVLKYELELESGNKEESARSHFKVHGYLLLTMPCGKFPSEIYAEQRKLQRRVEAFLEEFILSRNLRPELTNPVSLKFDTIPEIRHCFYIAAYIFMKDMNSFKLLLKFASVLWIMDDYLAKSSSGGLYMPFLSRGFFVDLGKICRNIFSGIYRKAEAVPYFEIPLFHHCLTALYEIQKELEECVGQKQYEKYHGYLLKEILDWIEGRKMEVHNFSDPQKFGYFEGTFWDLRRSLSWRGAILELVQLLSGANLDEIVRGTKLFKMFWERGIVAHVMTKDVLGSNWNKDGGPVLRKIERLPSNKDARKQSLKRAFERTVEDLNDCLMDFEKLGRDILMEYPKSGAHERLQRFVRNFQCFVDGGIRGFVEDKRSSKKGKFQVLKVKF